MIHILGKKMKENPISTKQQFTEGPGPFERIFITPAVAKIIDFLLTFDQYDYSESEIARRTNLSFKTVSRALKILLSEGIVKHTRNSGQSKMFMINDCDTVRARALHQFYYDITCTSN
jgi:DNA-binding MarR family transcriptional regulator